MKKLAVALFLGAVVAGCGSDGGGSSGSSGGGGSGGGGAGMTFSPTFTNVNKEILMGSCALSSSCHKGTGKAKLVLDVEPYKALMGDGTAGPASCEFPTQKLVVPMHPEQSVMYLKVTTPPAGAPDPMCPGTSGKNERMPMSNDMLDAPRLQLLKDWINAGAKND